MTTRRLLIGTAAASLMLVLAWRVSIIGAQPSRPAQVAAGKSPASQPAESVDDPAVTAGRKALSDGPVAPWYDQQIDAPRRIEVDPDSDPDGDNQKEGKQSAKWKWSDWFIPVVWVVIALLLAVLVFALIRAYLRSPGKAKTNTGSADDAATNLDRLLELPVPVRKSQGDLLGEARRLYQAGNFREAIIYLYSHQLLALDKQQIIRLSRGKTNRQYLKELAAQQGLRGLLEHTMLIFEDVFFGDQVLSRDRFETCWNRLPEFDSLVRSVRA